MRVVRLKFKRTYVRTYTLCVYNGNRHIYNVLMINLFGRFQEPLNTHSYLKRIYSKKIYLMHNCKPKEPGGFCEIIKSQVLEVDE